MKELTDKDFLELLDTVGLGGNNELRSKSRVVEFEVNSKLTVDMLPAWNYDGSSTDQTTGLHSEIIIKPKHLY